MSYKQQLVINQSQRLVLTPQLRQRIEMLQMTKLELGELVSQQMAENPVLEELDFDGAEVPRPEVLERLDPKVTDPIALMHVLSQDTRIFAFVMQRVDWQGAGFQKVATIGTRDGDEQAALPSSGISWTALAERYRGRFGA